jgi:hypothetical protein
MSKALIEEFVFALYVVARIFSHKESNIQKSDSTRLI